MFFGGSLALVRLSKRRYALKILKPVMYCIYRNNVWSINSETFFGVTHFPTAATAASVGLCEVFKEPIDFKVLDKVPVPRGLLQIVQGRAEEYTKYILTDEDRTAVEWVPSASGGRLGGQKMEIPWRMGAGLDYYIGLGRPWGVYEDGCF